jgi:hypothetical protein
LNLLFCWFERADAQNYAPRLVGESPVSPKHVFVTAGTEDHYVAPESHNAVTTAARLWQLSPRLAEVTGQTLLATLDPGAHGVTHPSLSGNLVAGGRRVTGAFRQ